MALNFPNPSRSYDPDRRRIRFWGHDQSMEVSFFLEEDAVFKLYPRTRNVEAAMLESFDLARDRIFEVAAKAYKPAAKGAYYVLTARDF
jgi:hypothetical protein